MEDFRNAAVCFLALAAVFWDLRKGIIPNFFILAGLLGGAIYQIVRLGAWGGVFFLGGVLFPVIVLAGLFYFRMIGAGDIKLLAALGGFLGGEAIGTCLLLTLLIGGALSLGLMLYRRNLVKRLRYFADYLAAYRRTGEWKPYRKEGEKGGEFPLTVPVFLSVCCYVGGFV